MKYTNEITFDADIIRNATPCIRTTTHGRSGECRLKAQTHR